MEEKCEIELTEGYHSINSRDVRLHIHKGEFLSTNRSKTD